MNMVRISGGDGPSIKNAIIISDCNHSDGIAQEYIEIRQRFRVYKLIEQRLLDFEGRKYDSLLLEVEGSQTIELFFDITDFFGKGFEF